MSGKQRLSASVDSELLRAAERAAARGEVATVNAWVSDAMRLKLERSAIERAFGQQAGNEPPSECEDPRILVDKP